MPIVRPPTPQPPPPEPTRGETIWSAQRSGRQIECEVRACGTAGWECQLFDDDWCIYRRRWRARDEAVADAEEQHRQLMIEAAISER